MMAAILRALTFFRRGRRRTVRRLPDPIPLHEGPRPPAGFSPTFGAIRTPEDLKAEAEAEARRAPEFPSDAGWGEAAYDPDPEDSPPGPRDAPAVTVEAEAELADALDDLTPVPVEVPEPVRPPRPVPFVPVRTGAGTVRKRLAAPEEAYRTVQELGAAKRAKVQAILGPKVQVLSCHTTRDHHVARAWISDRDSIRVDYKRGRILDAVTVNGEGRTVNRPPEDIPGGI